MRKGTRKYEKKVYEEGCEIKNVVQNIKMAKVETREISIGTKRRIVKERRNCEEN